MKFYLLSVLASLMLAAHGESVGRPLMIKKWPYQVIKDWEKFMAEHSRQVDARDVGLDNIWNSQMPRILTTCKTNDGDFKDDTVYQLTCEAMANGNLPAEYNVHFLSGKDGANRLGSYNVKSSAKNIVFTADQDGLTKTKHQVLEVETVPGKPVTLLIKPKAADAFSCRVEVPNTKHPYNSFSPDVNIGSPVETTTPTTRFEDEQNPFLGKH